jgi:hypothetical protein
MRKGEKMSEAHKAAIARGRRRYLRGLKKPTKATKSAKMNYQLAVQAVRDILRG